MSCIVLIVWCLLQHTATIGQLYNYKVLYQGLIYIVVLNTVQTLIIRVVELYQSKLIVKENIDFP